MVQGGADGGSTGSMTKLQRLKHFYRLQRRKQPSCRGTHEANTKFPLDLREHYQQEDTASAVEEETHIALLIFYNLP